VKIILFGSVARGDDTDESDIDILIFIKKEMDEFEIRDDIYSKTFNTLLKTGEYLSAKIIPMNHYKKYKGFSFYTNIDEEGVVIG
jgi:predicted nucleotidyltransferase